MNVTLCKMKIERYISIFDPKDDKLVGEIKVSYLNEQFLKTIFHHLDDDPHLYRPYKIHEKEYLSIIEHVEALRRYAFKDFEMFIEAVQE